MKKSVLIVRICSFFFLLIGIIMFVFFAIVVNQKDKFLDIYNYFNYHPLIVLIPIGFISLSILLIIITSILETKKFFEIFKDIKNKANNQELYDVNQLPFQKEAKALLNRIIPNMDSEVLFNHNLENEYFRDIPCKKDIFKTYWLSYRCKLIERKQLLVGALLLKWMFEDKININVDTKEIEFYSLPKFENESEYSFYDIFEKSLEKDKTLKIDEVSKWMQNNAKSISDFLDYALKLEEETLVNNDLISYSKKEVSMILGSAEADKVLITLGDDLNKDLSEIMGFKNFIKDFTLIKLREVKEVHIWEEYLVFSYLLGIADMSDSQLKELIPEYETIKNIVDSLPHYMMPVIDGNTIDFIEPK